MVTNVFAFIFVVLLPLGIVVGMAAVLIRDRIRAGRRAKRLHKEIKNWYDLRVD